VPAVALVASRAVPAGEELFLDYGFVPRAGKPLPEWYTPVPPGEWWRQLAAACSAARLPLPPGTPREVLLS
jgi:hypothetical protein